MTVPLDDVRVVLCEPSHPGNIGASARAMKTMGLRRLVLVAPKAFPDPEATARASGADDVLDAAEVVASLPDALAGVHFAIATSARLRAVPMPVLEPRAAARRLLDERRAGPVALVFGRERSGLGNAEIDCCQALLQIPTDPAFSSLNLAAAVQLLAYELRLAALVTTSAAPADRADEPDGGLAALVPETAQQPPSPGGHAGAEARPDLRAMESFFAHLEATLFAIRFLVPGQSETLMRRLRRLVHRAAPSRTELDILRGILSRIDGTVRRAQARDERH